MQVGTESSFVVQGKTPLEYKVVVQPYTLNYDAGCDIHVCIVEIVCSHSWHSDGKRLSADYIKECKMRGSEFLCVFSVTDDWCFILCFF